MANFTQMSKRFQSLNPEKMYLITMSNQTEEIVEQNREQMMEGKTSKGKKIKPKYKNKSYAQKKKRLNSKPGAGTPDLKLSGDFHASLSLKKKGTDFLYETKLGYAKKYVIPKYDDILGLEPKRKKIFNNKTFKPEYVRKIKQHLQIL